MRKTLALLTLALYYALSYASIQSNRPIVIDEKNPIVNLQKENLRVLDIGNSYTNDATHYLSQTCTAFKYVTGYSVYTAIRAGASFKSWVDTYNDTDNLSYNVTSCVGDKISEITEGTGQAGDGSIFRNALKNGKWDLIIIHQLSNYSTNFDNWESESEAGYLKELIQILRETNPQAAIGTYLIHSYRSSYSGNSEKSSLERWKNIATATKKFCLNYGIDFVIPYGTAVQNLRATSLSDENEFSTDGTHLADGLGDYVAACCYWQSLFAPRTGIDIIGNTYRKTDLNESTQGILNITDETALIAQKAAMLAVNNMYQITDVDKFDAYMQLPAELIYFDNHLIGYNYNKPIGDIIIPEGVISITRATFNDCKEMTSISIPKTIEHIGNYAFKDCISLTSIISHIENNLFEIDPTVFQNIDKSNLTLYVPYGTKDVYATTNGWSDFGKIVEMDATEIKITINEYGCATYCSPFALDFSNVSELKAYSAIGFNSETNVVTLARTMTTSAGMGVFLKGEPGTYTVPVINSTNEHTLNLLVGTLDDITVGRTNEEMSNYKLTVIDNDNTPMFYPFEDNTKFSAGKAYLQIPTEWLQSVRQKTIKIDIHNDKTTNIDDVDTESGYINEIYDLKGNKRENPGKGIYIINGKKVFIK